MSTIYEESTALYDTSWILFSGQLVKIRLNCFEQDGVTGIIIECVYPDFGTGSDKWLVFTNGNLMTLASHHLWPIEEN